MRIRRMQGIGGPEDPRYVANELLLTFTTPATPTSSDEKQRSVQMLQREALAIATGDGNRAASAREQTPGVQEQAPGSQEAAPTMPTREIGEGRPFKGRFPARGDGSEGKALRDALFGGWAAQPPTPPNRIPTPEREGRPISWGRSIWDRIIPLIHIVEEVIATGARAARDRRQEDRPQLGEPPLTVRVPLPPTPTAPKGRDNVRVAVDRINSGLSKLRDPVTGIAVSSAIPNWIMSSSVNRAQGGPGTAPDPAPDGAWRFTMRRPGGQGAQGQGDAPRQPVVVAILDTWPGSAGVGEAATRYPGNWLMQQLAAPQAITTWEPDSGAIVPPRLTYADADHGLFVAGIIHSIAPHTELRLLHVLNSDGLGSADRLLAALGYCLTLARSGRRVVVNMSLYLLIPPADAPQDLWDVWFKGDPAYRRRTRRQNDALIELLDEPIEQCINLLLDAGAVVIAAAGNDALVYGDKGRPNHLQPRLPGDYDTVFCVVATDRAGKIANYSNRADTPMTGNCVATFGGQGVMQVAGSPLQTIIKRAGRAMQGLTGHSDARGQGGGVVVAGSDGVVGVYTAPDIAAPGDNTSGWAYWSGTSFATPIISGLAANILSQNEAARRSDPAIRPLTPRGVMARVLAMAAPAATTDPALGCPYIPVVQEK